MLTNAQLLNRADQQITNRLVQNIKAQKIFLLVKNKIVIPLNCWSDIESLFCHRMRELSQQPVIGRIESKLNVDKGY